MRVHVKYDGLQDLQSDLAKVPVIAAKAIPGIVQEGVRTGGTLARDNARRTAGKHGRNYPSSITWDRSTRVFFGFGGASYSASYGPDAAKSQGGMSFEFGSRNQKPHLDLAHSADVIGPAFQGEIRRAVGDWFWPES